MTADGSHLRDFGFAVATRYQPFGSAAGTAAADPGIYNNLAFESLTLSADGKTLYTATENALAQDGLVSTLAHGTTSRLLSFDVASGASGAEYVVEVDKVASPPNPSDGFATNGLTSGTQFTQFVALSVAAIPEPQTYALLLAGLGALGWVVRRRRR